MTPAWPRRTRVRRSISILALVALSSASLVAGARAAPSPDRHLTARATDVPPHALPVAPWSLPVGTGSPITVRAAQPIGPSATAARRDALQARLERIRAKYGIPGISVTLLFPDGSRWVGTSGLSDVRAATPVTPDTAFAIASVTKTFTAALVLALVQEDRLRLDTSVAAHLPDLELDPGITVRQLLDHTSGLRDYFFHARIDHRLLSAPERRWTEARALRYVGKPYFKPGRGWHYSNTNYLVLGLLAEAVAGEPLATQYRRRFLEPLGLRHTYYQPTETASGPVARGYRFESTNPKAKAIDLSDGTALTPFSSVVTAAAGAGAIAATSTDLARWARALYAGNVLRADSLEAMLGDSRRTERYRPTVPYGLGVQLAEVGGHATLGHSGRLLGFRSLIRWLPDEDVSIAVVTNQSRTDPAIVARALLKIALAPADPCGCDDRR